MISLPDFKLKQLPLQWEWLLQEPELPKVIEEGLKHYGILEIPGKDSNPDISKWAKELGVENDYTNDDIPWCGLFVGVMVKRSGDTPVSKPLWARNWLLYGTSAKVPMLGDVLVFARGSGGHVAFYIGQTEDAYAVLGGNQSNSVTITFILKNRLLGARRRVYDQVPASVRAIALKRSGALSTNEA